jgi:membrane fusion protein, multidrug efflux system
MERDRKALSQQAFDQARADLRAVEAQIQAVRVTLSKTEIRAPFAGRVGIRRVSEGAWVTPETRLTTLQDTSRIKVDFTLPERYAPAIEPGREFTFRIAGRPETFAGRVLAIEPRIDADTRSLLVRGLTENESGALVPGAFATVEVPLEAISGGVSVPAEALIPSVQGHGVYVFRDGKAELRPVRIGVRTSNAVQILTGLEPGETVLTTNLLRLGPGTPVELVEDGPERAS